jgi:hypothetical protein
MTDNTLTRHHPYHQSLDVLALSSSPFTLPIVLYNPEPPGIPSNPEGYASDIINDTIITPLLTHHIVSPSFS